MVELDVTREETTAGKLNAAHLAEANRALVNDGLVILKGVIDPVHIDLLRDQMLEDASTILKRTDIPIQFSAGNIQQDPPPYKEFLFRDILANNLVIEVTKSVLGSGLASDFYSGNTNFPGSKAQPVHTDQGQLWPNMTTAHPAYRLVVNVPVVDMDERNGSTEVWPSTHLDTNRYVQTPDLKISERDLEGRRKIVAPLQPSVKIGSVLIRDMRMWHRGMPNYADVPRPMIAMIHSVSWWPTGTIILEEGAQSIVAHEDLCTKAQFVSGKIDYLNRHGAYDVQAKNC